MQLAPFALRLFGGIGLEGPDGPVTGRVAQRRRLALLAVLALSPGRVLSRDRLLSLLWPEATEAEARHRLSSALYELRQVLGDGALVTRGADLWLSPEAVITDVERFEEAVARGNHDAAIGCYCGPFLDGVHVTGASELEHWIDATRERLARAYAAMLEQAAAARTGRGDQAGALDALYRLAALDPYSARVTLRLMQALAAGGDRAAAIQRAREHAALLREEIGAEPDPEVVALAARLRAGSLDAIEARAERPTGSSAQHSPDTAAGADPSRAVVERAAADTPTPLPVRARAARSTRRQRAVLVASLALVLSLSGGPLHRPRSSPVATPAIARVVVLPFEVRGQGEHAYLADGIVDLLSTALDGAGPLRTVDPHALLAHLAADSSVRPHDPAGRKVVARHFGVARVVAGSVFAAGDELRIRAGWYDAAAADAEPVAHAAVAGPASRVLELVDELAAQLIASESRTPAQRTARVAARTTNSLAALKAYLAGEADFRAGRFIAARESFTAAVRADTTFALAYYRLALAILWADQQGTSSDDAEARALRHSSRLSDHDRTLLLAYLALRRGTAGEAERFYRDIVAAYPDDVEAWFHLGETLFHYNPLRGRPIAESATSFERVTSLDREHWGARWHLALLAAQQGEWQEVERLANELLRLDPDGERTIELRTVRALATRDRSAFERLRPELHDAHPLRLAGLSWRAAVHFRDLDVAARIARIQQTSPDVITRTEAQLELSQLDAVRGRRRAAAAWWTAIDPAILPHGRFVTLALPLLVPSFPASRGELDTLAARIAAVNHAAPDRTPARTSGLALYRLYVEGLIAIARNDTSTARAHASTLARASDDTPPQDVPRRLAAVLRAHIARAAGRPRAALAELDAAPLDAWYGAALTDPIAGQAHERFLRAELLHELGRYEEALRWYASLGEHALHDLVYLAPAELRSAQIYERTGRTPQAIARYSRVIELWRDADPTLQPWVEAARQRLHSRRAGMP